MALSTNSDTSEMRGLRNEVLQHLFNGVFLLHISIYCGVIGAVPA